MHSRAIQVSQEKIQKQNWLTSDALSYSDGMPIPIADYITDSNDRLGDIDWLVSYLSAHDEEGKTPGIIYVEGESITFHRSFITHYFASKLDELKKECEILTLDQFMENYSLERYNLERLLHSKDGFYIYSTEDSWMMTLDEFLRHVYSKMQQSARTSLTYYIGGTLDYHF